MTGAWEESQQIERAWWDDCANTYNEETKQLTYAKMMGLESHTVPTDGRYPHFRLDGRSVIDIGGGPVSLLLKAVDAGRMVVVDPCPYPAWVVDRYHSHGVECVQKLAEEIAYDQVFDEAWIYNVLQHVQDPELVVAKARRSARLVRIFEWIGLPVYKGHPHSLNAQGMDRWLGSTGSILTMHGDLFGGATAYFGAFRG